MSRLRLTGHRGGSSEAEPVTMLAVLLAMIGTITYLLLTVIVQAGLAGVAVKASEKCGLQWRDEEIRVTIDGPSGTYDDDSQPGADSKPEKAHEHGRQQEVGSLADAQPPEVRTRAEYYEALRAVDQRMATADRAETPSSPALARSGWDAGGASGHPDRPPPDSIRVTPERAQHILDGDSWGGGHRHGTGRPMKTEFPSGWDDDRIVGHVLDVTRAPDEPPVFQANHRWRVHGQREHVGITAIVQPDGRIWSAWPDAGSPGVVKNPKETK